MAQFEQIGGGTTDSAGRKVERRIVVATGGATPTAPGSQIGGLLTQAAIFKDAAGTSRGTYEYTLLDPNSESAGQYFPGGKRVELTGGTREVPIQTHPEFATLSETHLAEVDTAIENKVADTWATFSNEKQQQLYNFLRRKVEYVLAPSVVGRITEVESALPSLTPIAKVADPPQLNAPAKTFWICTAITATPVGDKFEVTREYTLNFSAWDDVETLYGWT
jgi:hypothetical protein